MLPGRRNTRLRYIVAIYSATEIYSAAEICLAAKWFKKFGDIADQTGIFTANIIGYALQNYRQWYRCRSAGYR